MYILGINSVFHESAACLLDDGRIMAASEEERFSRVKHAKKPRPDNPHALPFRAMHDCLKSANIDIRQLSHIGFSSNPEARRAFDAKLNPFWPNEFADNIERVPDLLRAMGFQGEFSWVDHHLAHAASAFYGSPFAEAAVVAIDGIGDDKTTASYFGSGIQLKLVQSFAPPNSLGFLWELVSMFLGFDIYDATKIMGLAAYGNPNRYARQFRRLVSKLPWGSFTVDNWIVQFDRLDYMKPSGYFDGLAALFKIKKRAAGEELRQEHMDIAACLQEVTDDVLLHLARHLHELTGATNLCLAGGVALNCVTNQRVFEHGPFEHLYVQPAAHDAGTALGAATYIWHHVLGNDRQDPMTHAYWGPEFSPDEIESTLRRHKLKFVRCDNIERDVAQLVSEGEVVGFFQGRMEIGPRALGNRSLLADPRHPGMREILNEKVKHREYFRPFAPSVLHEDAHRWFLITKETSASDFMLMAYPVPAELRDSIPAVVHFDGTSRVQTVRRETNPRFHKLISEFRDITGVPVVLNTSFNDSEPIVCSPEDAVDTFLKTNIDYLAIGDYLVAKKENSPRMTEQRTGNDEARMTNDENSPFGIRHSGIRHSFRAPLLHRLCPDVHTALDRALGGLRLARIDDLVVVTDRCDVTDFNQVLPLFPEQQFFIDEIRRELIQQARVLEIGIGSGVLSLAAIRAGAASVVGLDTSPRARAVAGFNAVLNKCEHAIDIRAGDDDVYRPVLDMRFDCIISNPPFVPMAHGAKFYRHSDAGPLGLDLLEKIFTEMDTHLVDGGYAQIVAVCLGTLHEPRLLCEMAAELLAGKIAVHVNPVPGRYTDTLAWLLASRSIDPAQARQLARAALDQRATHTHLCMIHYEKNGPHELTVVPSRKTYERWHSPLTALEF
jgi:carbamoyltransferase